MIKTLAIVTFATALLGCGTTRLLDTEVTSFGSWPLHRAPGSFAFERLPSQQAQAAQQDDLEAAALPALEQAGFKAVDNDAQLLVQVASRSLRHSQGHYNARFYEPYWHSHALYVNGWRGVSFGLALSTPHYLHEVSLLIRNRETQNIVYETRAQSDSRWASEALNRALFEAALKDFPHTAVSPRRVTVEMR